MVLYRYLITAHHHSLANVFWSLHFTLRLAAEIRPRHGLTVECSHAQQWTQIMTVMPALTWMEPRRERQGREGKGDEHDAGVQDVRYFFFFFLTLLMIFIQELSTQNYAYTQTCHDIATTTTHDTLLLSPSYTLSFCCRHIMWRTQSL
jgi:hypothetical protein